MASSKALKNTHKIFPKDTGSSSEEETEIERELANVSFEELQRAMSDGSHVPRIKHGKFDETKKEKRIDKNRPSEMSTKVPVGRFREVIQAPKKKCVDPRFGSLGGRFSPEVFRSRYNFLYEEALPAEKDKLKKLLKKSKDANLTEELKNHISWIDQQIKSAPRRSVEAQVCSEHYKNERQAAKLGKRVYYIKKGEVKKRAMIKKYEELEGQGKVEQAIEKRRRKNAAKDHRFMPYRRSNETAQD